MKKILYLIICLFSLESFCQNTNNSLFFDGIDDYVEFNSIATPMSMLQSFTVEFTIKADLNNQSSSIRTSIFSINTSNGNNRILMILGGRYSQEGKLMIYDEYSWGTNASYVSGQIIGDDQCHKISYSYNNGLASIYIDGMLMSTTYMTVNLSASDLYSLGQEWDVSGVNPSSSQFYNGYIDDFRIWSTDLSSQEVLLYMDSSLTGYEPNLLINYDFNNGLAGGINSNVITLNNQVSNSYDGNLNSFQLSGMSSNWVMNPCSVETIIHETVCDSFLVNNGITIYNSGVYIDSLITIQGLDSIVKLNLTVNKSDSVEDYIAACGSYTWEGDTYNSGGTYTKTFVNELGCDSVVKLNLTINTSDSTENYITACESYTWEGDTYNSSGAYIKTFLNQLGCDSVVKLNLIINTSDSVVSDITTCDSYAWKGNIYTSSGIYTETFVNQLGCDSVEVLNLTVNNSRDTVHHITVCHSYVWRGNTYNNSGVYTEAFVNQLGCDSLITLNLTINTSDSIVNGITTCDNYIWRGNAYNNSGIYTETFANQLGCDSVLVLDLTINTSDSIVNDVIACDNYIWRGNTYSNSGIYTEFFVNQLGCDSVLVLDLKINNKDSIIEYVACDSVFVDGTWYDSSFVDTIFFYELGCERLVITNYDVLSCSINIHIPNVFTPNGDGVNDFFKIESNDVLIEEGGVLKVYNRWGNMVFQSSDKIKWDGGRSASGVYYYIFMFKNKKYTGTVSLYN